MTIKQKLPETNILIVDDSESDLKLYTQLILQAGERYRVHAARTASQALSLFDEKSIDCAFIDFYLPEVNGLRILEQLQEKASGRVLPIIIFTGNASQTIQAEAARRGAMDYIVKDAEINTPEQFDRSIRKVIAWADDLNRNRVRVN